jgi:stringent starvation protein B
MTDAVSTKPYLLRALFEWCMDNGYTPYISVLVNEATRVPQEYVRNGEIVLNIGPLAANKLKLGNDVVELAARFGGVARELVIPVSQVTAIYARENGHGMSFEPDKREKAWETSVQMPEEPAAAATSSGDETDPPTTPGKPTLRVVK